MNVRILTDSEILRAINPTITEQQENIVIRKMQESDLDEIKLNLEEVYHNTKLPGEMIWMLIDGEFDITKSLVATVNSDLAGFYFLNAKNIPKLINVDYSKFRNKKGIEGVALGVFNKYRNLGVGKKLIEYTQNNLNYDYIWGAQFKSLNNINDWLKRRDMYADLGKVYVTYRLLK